MKKSKQQIASAVLEAVVEIVLTVICLALGALVLRLFGADFSLWETDADIVILIGVVVFFVVLLLVCTAVKCIKNAIGKKRDDSQS